MTRSCRRAGSTTSSTAPSSSSTEGDSAGATADGQAQLHAFYDNFPNSPVCNIPKGQLAPVIARFDQMSSPFQAIVWGRVLPLDTLDQAKILAFYEQWAEKTNPEKQCAVPSASTNPTDSTAPSASPSTRTQRDPGRHRHPRPEPDAGRERRAVLELTQETRHAPRLVSR